MSVKPDWDSVVLGALSDGALHGYAILKVIREAGLELKAGEGQLYPVLHRLEDDGFISGAWEPQEGKPPRRVYALTEEGTAELARRREVFLRQARALHRVLGVKPEGA